MERRLCTQCVRASTESNDRGNSIFVKRLETFVLALYKKNFLLLLKHLYYCYNIYHKGDFFISSK